MLAVCHGSIDFGASSSLQTVAGLETNNGCQATTVITTVAYDAVDVIVLAANVHQLQSMSWETLVAICDGTSGGAATLLAPSIEGQSITGTAILNVAPRSTHAALASAQIPACDFGAASCGGVTTAGALPIARATSAGTGAACAGNANLICENTGATPCGLTVCGGGTTPTAIIQTVARSDASGTTQTFEARLLGATSGSGFGATTAALGFNGCGSNNLIKDCEMTSTKTGVGNPGAIASVAGIPDAIGYASDGLARASGSGVVIAAFNGFGGSAVAGTGTANGAIVPTTEATDTIWAGIQSSATVPNYAGWRPFEFATTNTPTGEVQRFIQFVVDPANNQNLASEAAEASICSVYEVRPHPQGAGEALPSTGGPPGDRSHFAP